MNTAITNKRFEGGADKCEIYPTTPFPGRGTPYDGLCGEAPPESGTFFRLQEYEGVGFPI